MKNNEWVKASRSNGSGGNNCVEVFVPSNADAVFVQHSRRPFGAWIQFTRAEWDAFVHGVKSGEFDL